MSPPLRDLIDDRPMSGFQWTVVAVCVLLNMLDGFDVLVMAFTGKSVSADWGLTGAELGLLLSAGLVGMAAGSMFLAPWADRLGRRPVVLGCLALASAAMLLSAASQSAAQLGVLRALTGLGIGGILATSNVIAAEYASRRWRGLAVSLNSTGYALGATIGGLLAALLIGQYGWRSVFLAGGLATAASIPLVWWRLPESLDFLLVRRPPRAVERINAVLARMGKPRLGELPEPEPAPKGVGYRELLTPRLRRTTLVLWAAFFCVMAGFYFVTSWTPTLLVEAGLSPSAGITGGTLLNVGGIFGAALLGLLAVRFELRAVLAAYLVVTGVLLAVFIASTTSPAVAFVVAALIGVFANGCVAGLYTLTPIVYAPAVRTTGVGTGLAIGRAGAILAPALAGALLDGGWTPQHLYVLFCAVFVVTAALLVLLRVRTPADTGATTTQPSTRVEGASS
ncbi:benzoate transport [Saccharopolyspora erythraea NRRL 2338]|uniref:Vanillate transporter (MFS superfamily) n=2 Tax=Saccharopolyspora erythraea TaxID=1836 RepID=A4FDH6_SACEN|nr:MFS transporter [Saccharopolyspora erythraea]EQD82542.1 MFS transporter [Saccharopolyspora erythraea D]PFG95840.1 benzoate transport [Saccharopolyspora erythraea NRRL 2338]QRK92420.1 MFS transporter [Saccharopolyspora erythraea]CAM02101.1 vanillate transporter (MFS superfamily) [Saccharopolyspora erythraea NRRL 2338]